MNSFNSTILSSPCSLDIDYLIQENPSIFTSPIKEGLKSLYDFYLVLSVQSEKNAKRLKCKKLNKKDLKNPPLNEVLLKSEVIDVELSGIWFDCAVDQFDKVFISARNFNAEKNCYELTSSFSNLPKGANEKNVIEYVLKNFIVVEPETILSPTQIKGGLKCLRNSIFQEDFKFNFVPDVTKATLIGNIVHALFESLLSMPKFQNANQYNNFIYTKLNQLLTENVFQIAVINETFENLKSECKIFIDSITQFYNSFIICQNLIEQNIKIESFVSSEKLYQSQTLGMKGIMDAVIRIESDDQLDLAPLEIKTGKQYPESDQLQVLVYCLILSEQFNELYAKGALIYLKDATFKCIKIRLLEMINIIVLRNNIVKTWKNYEKGGNKFSQLFMPNVLKEDFSGFSCKTCFKREICQGLYNIYEKKDSASFDEAKKNYFRCLYEIINKEQQRDNYYTNGGKKRDLTEYTQCQIKKIVNNTHSFSFEVSPCESSEKVITKIINVTEEFSIFFPDINKETKGYVHYKNANENFISLNVLNFHIGTKILNFISNFDAKQNNIVFLKSNDAKTKFMYKLMRGNLITLCVNPTKSEIISNLQQLLIYMKIPLFTVDEKAKADLFEYIQKYFDEFMSLDNQTRNALISCCLCNDYVIVRTSNNLTLLYLLITYLHKKKNKILLCAHTNCAVDAILKKLSEKKFFEFIRVGNNKNRIDKEIPNNQILDENANLSLTQWKEILNKNFVYATTTLGIGHIAMYNKIFDYCIVDESDSIFEPDLLGPLLQSRKFILIGDNRKVNLFSVKKEEQPMSLYERLKLVNGNAYIEC